MKVEKDGRGIKKLEVTTVLHLLPRKTSPTISHLLQLSDLCNCLQITDENPQHTVLIGWF